jgi:phosphoribosylformylglycinamidine synthase subunit PurQ / glutaminase
MKFGVLVFPGSNCDDDMIHVMQDVFKKPVEKLWHKDSKLPGFNPGDVVFIPGGFSYGDYLRCGAIARFSPLMADVIRFAKEGGIVIGICNGFQILCESGLLPGQLLPNLSESFICKSVYLKPASLETPLTYNLDGQKAYKIPIAHADGRYYADDQTLKSLQDNQQIMFQYCTAEGALTEAANVNGSCLNIAGICNEDRNVCGMMPHPERASEAELGNSDGHAMFESLFSWIKERHFLLA